ncbi:MAG TPA: hypothetical protein DD738_06245 [Ruminiclostridium sp.]|nr:hypothetical protein [Ruminiclostridium sp.]
MKVFVIQWKKLIRYGLFLASAWLIILFCRVSFQAIPVFDSPAANYFEPQKPKGGSLEEMYLDALIASVMPYIDQAVADYYIEHIGYSPNVDPWDIKVIYIKRPNGDRTAYFEMKLEMQPYMGAHNSIGVDQITLSIFSNRVEIDNFKHVKSFPIPSWLR